jgi:hypothetical protein
VTPEDLTFTLVVNPTPAEERDAREYLMWKGKPVYPKVWKDGHPQWDLSQPPSTEPWPETASSSLDKPPSPGVG